MIIGVDLFAGAGGMSLGARLAGVSVKMAVESDPWAAATYKRNHPNTSVLSGRVEDLQEIRLERRRARKILFGGAPCQGFSTSNQKTRNSSNASNWLFRHFVRVAALWKPDWVVFENVKGITETEHGKFLKMISKSLERLSYTLSPWLLDAADYGVPQKRRRLFLIGSIKGKRISDLAANTTPQPITVAEAISDLPLLENGASISELPYQNTAESAYAKSVRNALMTCRNNIVTCNSERVVERYSFIPQGGNWQDIPAHLMQNYHDPTRCHTRIYHRLIGTQPSVVVGNFRKNMLIHPTQNRGLSVREAARLQSFPDWYEFLGSIGFQQQQVGNAVPPLLAKAVFETIIHND